MVAPLKVVKYEVTVLIDKENARLEEIAAITVTFYEEASIGAYPWRDKPVTFIVVESDEDTLRQFITELQETLQTEVTFRLAPYFLYE